MRRRSPRRDDREVDAIVPLGDQSRRDVGADVGLGPPDERDLAGVELGRDTVRCSPGGSERRDLCCVLLHPQRIHHGRAAHVVRPRPQREEVDEESRPHRVADGGDRRAPDQFADDRNRVVRLVPRAHPERVTLLDDARRLQPWDHQRRIAVTRHHEHRQALERHRFVPRQVWQIAADRHEQHVHPCVRHRPPRPLQPLREHDGSLPEAGRVRVSGAHGVLGPSTRI